MKRVIVALEDETARALIEDLSLVDIDVAAVMSPSALRGGALVLEGVEALLMPADRSVLRAELRAQCDRAGVRILLFGDGDSAQRLARRYGLGRALASRSTAWQIAEALGQDALTRDPSHAPEHGSVIAVWGPHGAPGRSTLAISLSAELARRDQHVALLDADTHAPSIALLLGLSEDGPGLAAACRRAELGSLDATELSRIAVPVETNSGPVEVLAGLNRPSRWPEISAERLRATLVVCRAWADTTIVDVGASLDADEELLSDIHGSRRNAATLTALEEADHIVAVASADPLGIARFIRAHAELRALTGSTPITVLINQVRPGPLGIDARGQIRRALDRFSGIDDLQFLPHDLRALDGALLHSRPVADVSPRSPFATAVRRTAATLRGVSRETANPEKRRSRSRRSREREPV